MSRKDKGRIEGPFVPMLVDTMASPAWRTMLPTARVLYVAVKSRYGFKAKNNGRIYPSTRGGGEIPVIKVGRLKRVPVRAMEAKLMRAACADCGRALASGAGAAMTKVKS